MPPESPEERRRRIFEAEIAKARAKAAAKKAAAPPAPSSEPVTEKEPAGAVAPVSPESARKFAGQVEADIAAGDLKRQMGKLRVELTNRERQADLMASDAEIQNRVDRQIKELEPKPIFAGDFALTRPQQGLTNLFPQQASPINLPAPQSENIVSTFLGAQTLVPERAARSAIVFDDSKFYKSIEGLSQPEQMERNAAYEGFKAAFNYTKTINPDATDEENFKLASEQIKDLQNILSGGKPKAVLKSNVKVETKFVPEFLKPLLERQVEEGTELPVINNIQAAFTEKFQPLSETAMKDRRRRELENVRMNFGRAPRPDEIEKQLLVEEKQGAFKLPFWLNKKKLEDFAANPEKYAEGGLVFASEYPTGTLIESPVNQFARIATMPLNVIPALAGGALKQGLGKVGAVDLEALSQSRPAKYRGTGLGANVLSGVQEMGGFTKEFYELSKYSTSPVAQKLAIPAGVVGFGLDLSGAGDIALIKGAAGLLKGGVAATAAAKAAGRASKIVDIVDIGKFAGKKALAAYIEEIPLIRNLGPSIVDPGDIRLVYGNPLASEESALAMWRNRYFNETMMNEPERLKQAANYVKQNYAGTEFAKRVDKLTPAEIEKLLGSSGKTAADDYLDGLKRIANGEEDLPNQRKIESLVAYAAKRDPSIRAELVKRIDFQKRIPPGLKEEVKSDIFPQNVSGIRLIQALSESVEDFDKVAKIITDIVTFENAVKKIDTAVSKLGLGAENLIAITPRTLATKSGAQKIYAEVDKSQFKLSTLDPIRQSPLKDIAVKFDVGKQEPITEELTQFLGQANITPSTVREGTQTVTKVLPAYMLSYTLQQRIINQIDGFGTVLNQGVINRIKSNASKAEPFILADDVRLLSYAEADMIARRMGSGFGAEALAEAPIGAAPEKFLPQGIKKSLAQERRFFELTSDLPVGFNRIKNKVLDSVKPFESILSVSERDLLTKAKAGVSNIGKMFKDDFERLAVDQNFRKIYGVQENASNTEKTIKLGLGAYGDEMPKIAYRAYAENLIQSFIYGTDRSPLYNAFFPAYRFGEAALKNDAAFKALIDDVSTSLEKLLTSDVAKTVEFDKTITDYLNNIRTKIEDVVKNNETMATKLKGGKLAVVDKSLLKDVLLVTYARQKQYEILALAKSDIYQNRPLDLSEFPRFLQKVPESQHVLANNFFYDMIADAIERPEVFSELIESSHLNDNAIFGTITGYMMHITERRDHFSEKLKEEGATALFGTQLMTDLYNLRATGKTTGLLRDIIESVDMFKTSDLTASLKNIEELITNKIPLDQYGSPGIAQMIREDLGGEAKFNGLLLELAKLSDEAAGGSISSMKALNFFRNMLDFYNSGYYFGMLSINPRFHGVNNFTAPLITAYTTGRWPINSGQTPLKNYYDAYKTVLLGKRYDDVNRSVVVVTDRFGNKYTRGDLYDAALKSGLFKSQLESQVPTTLRREMRETIGEPVSLRQAPADIFSRVSIPKKAFGQPLATFTDDIHRMTILIDTLKSGETLDKAIELGRRSLFDYGNMYEFEKKISRNFFIFYNFWRQSAVQFMRNVVSDPLRVMKYIKITPNLEQIAVGDTNARDLSFYYPSDWGRGRAAYVSDSGVTYREGRAILGPILPHNDAVNLLSDALLNPVSMLFGPPTAGPDGNREYTEGQIYSRLGPGVKIGGGLIFNADALKSISLKPNRIPTEHVAIWYRLDYLPIVQSLYPSLKWIPAAPDESGVLMKGYSQPMVAQISDADQVRYKQFMVNLNTLGVSRPINDWSKMLNAGILVGDSYAMGRQVPSRVSGEYATMLALQAMQNIGLITITGATAPATIEKRAIDAQTKEVEEILKKFETQ